MGFEERVLQGAKDISRKQAAVMPWSEAGSTTVAGAVLAIPVTHGFVTKTTGGAEALTLADGKPGQDLTIRLGTDGGDGTLTPATKTGFVSITFEDVGDTVHLRFIDTSVGWIIIGAWGVLAQPPVNLS